MDEKSLTAGITYYRLMEAVESFSADSRLNAAVVSRRVMAEYFANGGGVSLKDLESFLKHLAAFSREEINLILWELRYLQSIKPVSDSDDVALLIRDSCERFAK